jgi:hypothetical protein
MMCILVLCALVSGSARECSADSMEAFYITEPQSRAECKDAFAMLKHVLPANLRLVRFEWAKPQVQTAQEPRR